MRSLVLVFALAFTLSASAEYAARCGKDAFGNDVCIDKDGVLTNSPKPSADKSSGNARKEGVSTEPRDGADDKASKKPVRCDVDPFGNKVCG